MGVLRKNPYDKVKINPLKLWGAITLLAIFASVSTYLLKPSTINAKEDGEGVTVEDGIVDLKSSKKAPPLPYNDPNCLGVTQATMEDDEMVLTDPEAGLVVVCGRVSSARIDPIDSNDDGSYNYYDTRMPVSGVTVALYEGNPNTDSGKDRYGNLVHLFSSTSTTDNGYFKLKMRGLGPKSSAVYVVVFCGEEYAGGQRLKSMRHLSNLDIAINCDPNPEIPYEYFTPYGAVNVVENRSSILECTVNVLKKAADVLHVAITNSKPVNIIVGGAITEENYDFRYVSKTQAIGSLSAGGFLSEGMFFEETTQGDTGIEGALWANDCIIANSSNNISDFSTNIVSEMTADELGDAWVCSSTGMDDEYGGKEGPIEGAYLVNTALRFIPEASQLLAWRRVDNRASFKQMNQYPFASLQAFKSMFGDYVGQNQFIANSESEFEEDAFENDFLKKDPLASCEKIEESTNTIALFNPNPEEGTILQNTKLSFGFGTLLSSPYLWDEWEKNEVGFVEREDPYCRTKEGVVYTAQQVLDDSELRKKYFRPELLLPKGAGNMPWNSEVTSDSCFQDSSFRKTSFKAFGTEAEQPCHDQARVVIPEGTNRNGSIVSTLYTTGQSGELNIYTMMDSPYGDTTEDLRESFAPEPEPGEEPKLKAQNVGLKPTLVMDIGNYVSGLCGVSEIYGDDPYNKLTREFLVGLEAFLHNNFLGNEEHITEAVVGSGTYYTADSLLRDKLLRDSSGWGEAEFGSSPFNLSTNFRDTFDSLLEMAASEDTINFKNINIFDTIAQMWKAVVDGEGELKSFGERSDDLDVNLKSRMVKYELNAENFTEAFPAYGEEGYPGEDNEFYPWEIDVPYGQLCNVWPGAGQNPTGELRTCKILNDECTTFVTKWVVDVGSEDDELVESTDTRDCTSAEKFIVLREQEDKSEAEAEPPPIESIYSNAFKVYKADLVRAGPYKAIIPFSIKQDAALQQDALPQVGVEPATPYDSVANSVYRFKRMFGSPGEDIKGGRLALIDWEFSKNPDGIVTNASGGQGGVEDPPELYGYDSPGYGFDPASAGLHSISASPTSVGGRGPYNEIIYHCNISFEDRGGGLRSPQPDKKTIKIPDRGPSGHTYSDFRYEWDCPVRPFVVGGICDPEAFDNIPGGIKEPVPETNDYFTDWFLPKFIKHPELLEAYGFASENTGVPCEILAGIHYMEGSNNPDQSLQNGDPISVDELPMSALTAAEHLLTKLGPRGADIEEWEFEDYVYALTNYYYSKDVNCDDPRTPWCVAPQVRKFYGEDAAYPMSWMDNAHKGMYVKYCNWEILCDPSATYTDDNGFILINRPGAIAFAKALNMYLSEL